MTNENAKEDSKNLVLFVGLPLLLLAGAYWLYWKRKRSGVDSPIIITDTSTEFRTHMTPKYPRTRVRHAAANGNDENFHKNSKNRFYVHDEENGKDTYRAAYFSVPGKPLVSLAQATTWEISFQDSNEIEVFAINWADQMAKGKDKGDITMDRDGFQQISPTDLTIDLQVTIVKWTVDGKVDSVGVSRGFEAIIHYCPKGDC